MKPTLLSYLVLLCLAGGVALAAAAAPPVGGSASLLYVDGADAGPVLDWDGGDPRAKAVAAGGAGTKQPGSPSLAPVIMRVPFPPSAPLAAWITEVAAGGSPQRAIILVDLDAMRRPAEAYEVSAALLTKIEFPTFDASAKEFGPMKLVFTGEGGRAVKVPAGPAPGPARKATTGFQLAVAGLDGKGVSRIEGLTIKQDVAEPAVGGDRFVRRGAPGRTEISNLKVTISRATVPTWRAWHDDFVIKAAGPEATKRDGVISLLDPTLKPVPLSLVLTGCGILSLGRPPETAGVPAKYVAEMFIERIVFTGLPPVVAGPKLPPAAELPPAEKKEPAAPASPADKGMRDPAEFPRVADLVRLTYSGNYAKTQTSEQATYAAAESANSLLARVTEAARGAGWELRTLDESESAGLRQIMQRWVRDQAGATVTIYEKAEVKGSQMLLQVHVTIPPK